MSQTPPPTAIETVSDEWLVTILNRLGDDHNLELDERRVEMQVPEVRSLITELLSRRSLDTADGVEVPDPGRSAVAVEGWKVLTGSGPGWFSGYHYAEGPGDLRIRTNDRRLLDKIISALASRTPNTGTVVKALEWTGDFNNTAYADSQFGKFAAWIINGSAYVRAPWFEAGGVPCGSTPDDAKKRALELIWEYVSPALASQPSPAKVTEWPLAGMDYMKVHDTAQAAYEAATPDDYRYSAVALRKAVDAGIAAALKALQLGKEG